MNVFGPFIVQCINWIHVHTHSGDFPFLPPQLSPLRQIVLERRYIDKQSCWSRCNTRGMRWSDGGRRCERSTRRKRFVGPPDGPTDVLFTPESKQRLIIRKKNRAEIPFWVSRNLSILLSYDEGFPILDNWYNYSLLKFMHFSRPYSASNVCLELHPPTRIHTLNIRLETWNASVRSSSRWDADCFLFEFLWNQMPIWTSRHFSTPIKISWNFECFSHLVVFFTRIIAIYDIRSVPSTASFYKVGTPNMSCDGWDLVVRFGVHFRCGGEFGGRHHYQAAA